MRLKVRDKEVDIKVKGPYDDKFNKEATMGFLNELCCYLGEARNMYRMLGAESLQTAAEDTRYDIYTILDNLGLYDRLNG